jgi:hypothetical protein
MDATGEEKEGDIDELFLKGHFIVESTENVVEQVEQQQEEAAGGGEEEEEEGEEEATDNVADEAKAAEVINCKRPNFCAHEHSHVVFAYLRLSSYLRLLMHWMALLIIQPCFVCSLVLYAPLIPDGYTLDVYAS